jgi:hypothetical protein
VNIHGGEERESRMAERVVLNHHYEQDGINCLTEEDLFDSKEM